MPFSFFGQRPQNTPPENGDAQEKSLKAFEESLQKLRTPEQLTKAMTGMRRHRERLSERHLNLIQDRLTALAGDVRTTAIEDAERRIQELRDHVAGTPLTNPSAAGESNPGMRIGMGIGATVLGWFGIRAVRRHGLGGAVGGLLSGSARGTVGTLSGGINFARRNPLMAALAAGLGVGATVQMRQYLSDNSDALVREIEASARERGINPETLAHDTGHRIADFIRSAGSSTVDTFVKGIVFVFRGTIDPQTGAITLPHSSLRPAFYVAYQAGERSRFSNSRTWRYLQGFRLNPFKTREERMLGIMDTAGGMAGDRARHIDFLNRQIQLERDPTRRAALERRVAAALNVQIGPQLQSIAAEAEALHRQNVSTFPQSRAEVNRDLLKLEQDVRTGTNIPAGQTVEEYKKAGLQGIDRKVRESVADLEHRKMSLGNQYAKTLTDLSRARMDRAGGGYIDATRKTMENAGYKFAQIPGGRWVVKAAVGYSLLPFGMELASATTNWLEGDVKKKRLRAQKASGQRLTQQEEQELSRLENQWKAVGLDAGQIAGGFIPIVGEALDFKAAITGKDLNGRDLSTMSRVTSGVMGTLGTASLILAPFTGGLSVVGFRAIRGGNAAAKGLKAATNVARVEHSVHAVAQSTRFLDQARAAGSLGAVQRGAMAARGAIQTARGGMQVFTYGVLGYHLGAGAVDFVQNSADRIADVRGRMADFAEHAGDSVSSRLPGSRPQRQTPEEP